MGISRLSQLISRVARDRKETYQTEGKDQLSNQNNTHRTHTWQEHQVQGLYQLQASKRLVKVKK